MDLFAEMKRETQAKRKEMSKFQVEPAPGGLGSLEEEDRGLEGLEDEDEDDGRGLEGFDDEEEPAVEIPQLFNQQFQ